MGKPCHWSMSNAMILCAARLVRVTGTGKGDFKMLGIFSRWKTVRDTGVNKYQVHSKTGDRRVLYSNHGFQPVDWQWVNEEPELTDEK
jgi:hypothetical protein